MIIAALILGASSQVRAEFQKLYEVPVPTKGPMKVVQYDSETNNLAFTTPTVEGKSNLYLLQNKERRVIDLGQINYVFGKVDCQDGILGIGRLSTGPDRIYFHRMTDGFKVGEMPWNEKKRRIGKAVQDHDQIVDLNGRLIVTSPTPPYDKPLNAYLGVLIWNGKRKLSIVGRGDVPSDIKDVVELDSQWKKTKRHWMSDYAMAFDSVVGNPDSGAFAVYERNSRDNAFPALFNRDLKRIGSTDMSIIDISPKGVMVDMLKPTALDWVSTGEYRCLNPSTGKVVWKGKTFGMWFGNNLVANMLRFNQPDQWNGQPILSGQTGKLIGKMPMEPKGALINANDGVYCFSLQNSNKLSVYRMAYR
jgi:hypothetical protein